MMKKRFFMLIGLMVLMVAPLFSQDPITGLSDWVARFPDLMTSLPGVIVQVVFLPPIVIGVLPWTGKALKYVVTGLIILILTLLAYFLDYGFLHGAKFWFAGATFGLLVLGQIIGYALVPGFFNLIEEKFNPWKPVEPTE